MNTTETVKGIQFTRIGLSEYVVHFLALLNDDDHKKAEENKADTFSIDTKYKIALKKAKYLHGRKYHNKSYGGGIAFYNGDLNKLADQIIELRNK